MADKFLFKIDAKKRETRIIINQDVNFYTSINLTYEELYSLYYQARKALDEINSEITELM